MTKNRKNYHWNRIKEYQTEIDGIIIYNYICSWVSTPQDPVSFTLKFKLNMLPWWTEDGKFYNVVCVQEKGSWVCLHPLLPEYRPRHSIIMGKYRIANFTNPIRHRDSEIWSHCSQHYFPYRFPIDYHIHPFHQASAFSDH